MMPLILVAGCTRHRPVTLAHPDLTEISVEKIGVMSFLRGRCPIVGETPACPISRFSHDPQNLPPGSDKILTGHLQAVLARRYGQRAIALPEVTAAYERIEKDETEDLPRTVAGKLGKALGADFIVFGTIWRFRERVGGPAGVKSPESVAFALYLVDVAKGKRVWTGVFDKTQRALSEDILDAPAFFKKGAKWVTASELARYGVEELFKRFPLK